MKPSLSLSKEHTNFGYLIFVTLNKLSQYFEAAPIITIIKTRDNGEGVITWCVSILYRLKILVNTFSLFLKSSVNSDCHLTKST